MKIKLSPVAHSYTTEVSLNGLVLTIDGQEIDLSVIPVGGQAEADENSPFVGVVTRDKVTIRYYYNSQLAYPNQSTDSNDYIFDVTDGEVPSPIKWKPVQIEEEIENV